MPARASRHRNSGIAPAPKDIDVVRRRTNSGSKLASRRAKTMNSPTKLTRNCKSCGNAENDKGPSSSNRAEALAEQAADTHKPG